MKKFLAIFLLVLLPLQFSWAAMASYCEHETSVTATHPGHHTHDHASVDQKESSKNSPQYPLHPQVIVSQLSRERPERPNWPVLA